MTNSSASQRRLAVVLSHPIQYYSPWFRRVAQLPGVVIRVFYLSDAGIKPTIDPRFRTEFAWDVDLLSGYDSEFVPNVSTSPGAESFGGFNNPELPGRLERWNPDALLLFGYKWRSHVSAIRWARKNRVPVLFRGDSHLLGRTLGPIKSLLLRIVYRRMAGFLFVGEANRDYFSALGVPRNKLFFCPHAVDPALFDPSAATHLESAARLRGALRVPAGHRVVLFAGKFTPAKQPVELAEAFLAAKPAQAVLVIAGDGEERPRLESLASRSANAIHLLPFANQSEMPARYLLGDIFALPSRGSYETWGLAVNEAMQMGRPCLVSDRVGCQRDLVTDGETGWVFRADDPDHLRGRLLAALATDPRSLHEKVRSRIAGYSYEVAAAGLKKALDQVAGKGK